MGFGYYDNVCVSTLCTVYGMCLFTEREKKKKKTLIVSYTQYIFLCGLA